VNDPLLDEVDALLGGASQPTATPSRPAPAPDPLLSEVDALLGAPPAPLRPLRAVVNPERDVHALTPAGMLETAARGSALAPLAPKAPVAPPPVPDATFEQPFLLKAREAINETGPRAVIGSLAAPWVEGAAALSHGAAKVASGVFGTADLSDAMLGTDRAIGSIQQGADVPSVDTHGASALTDPRWWTRAAGQGLGSSLSLAVAAMAGGPGAMAAGEAAAEALGVYNTRLRENGGDIEEAGARAAVVFAANYALLKGSNLPLLNPVAKTLPGQVLTQAATEGLQEGAQSIASNVMTDKPWQEGLAESMAAGAVGGPVVGAMLGTGAQDPVSPVRPMLPGILGGPKLPAPAIPAAQVGPVPAQPVTPPPIGASQAVPPAGMTPAVVESPRLNGSELPPVQNAPAGAILPPLAPPTPPAVPTPENAPPTAAVAGPPVNPAAAPAPSVDAVEPDMLDNWVEYASRRQGDEQALVVEQASRELSPAAFQEFARRLQAAGMVEGAPTAAPVVPPPAAPDLRARLEAALDEYEAAHAAGRAVKREADNAPAMARIQRAQDDLFKADNDAREAGQRTLLSEIRAARTPAPAEAPPAVTFKKARIIPTRTGIKTEPIDDAGNPLPPRESLTAGGVEFDVQPVRRPTPKPQPPVAPAPVTVATLDENRQPVAPAAMSDEEHAADLVRRLEAKKKPPTPQVEAPTTYALAPVATAQYVKPATALDLAATKRVTPVEVFEPGARVDTPLGKGTVVRSDAMNVWVETEDAFGERVEGALRVPRSQGVTRLDAKPAAAASRETFQQELRDLRDVAIGTSGTVADTRAYAARLKEYAAAFSPDEADQFARGLAREMGGRHK
jgi:hypothetical protein